MNLIAECMLLSDMICSAAVFGLSVLVASALLI